MKKRYLSSLFISSLLILTNCDNKKDSSISSSVDNPSSDVSSEIVVDKTGEIFTAALKEITNVKAYCFELNDCEFTIDDLNIKATLGQIAFGFDDNNNLIGNGTLKGSVNYPDSKYDFTADAFIKDNSLYANLNDFSDENVTEHDKNSIYLSIPLDAFINYELVENYVSSIDLSMISVALDYVYNDLLPFVNGIINYYEADINNFARGIIKALFDIEEDATTYTATFNATKFENTVLLLDESPIFDVIDEIFGKGTASDLALRLIAFPLKTVGSYVDSLKEAGADLVKLLESTDNLIKTFTNNTSSLMDLTNNKDLVTMLKDEQYRKKTIAGFLAEVFDLSATDVIKTIKEAVESSKQDKVEIDKEKLHSICTYINDYIVAKIQIKKDGKFNFIQASYNKDDIKINTKLTPYDNSNFKVGDYKSSYMLDYNSKVKITKEILLENSNISEENIEINDKNEVVSFTIGSSKYNVTKAIYLVSKSIESNDEEATIFIPLVIDENIDSTSEVYYQITIK